ncbi:MAG: YqgE/AlgH family protein [Planctomycetota bacterium]|nr:YqgE/AlgH family protein [Planctomycetota bacterium]MDA1113194.1 YqgE/AlgH family protein [Planctomycetota bacterium]
MNVTPGCFLISRPAMLDPNFDGTVVLICTHDEEGTVGLTLNRPLEVPIEHVLPDAEYLHDAGVPLLWGGPVGTDAVHVLSSCDPNAPTAPPSEDTLPVLPGVNFGGGLDLVRSVFQENGTLRFLLGYSGWSPGQLDEELAADGWYVVAGDVEEVWTSDWRLMWERLMAKMNPEFAWMREIPENPEVN